MANVHSFEIHKMGWIFWNPKVSHRVWIFEFAPTDNRRIRKLYGLVDSAICYRQNRKFSFRKIVFLRRDKWFGMQNSKERNFPECREEEAPKRRTSATREYELKEIHIFGSRFPSSYWWSGIDVRFILLQFLAAVNPAVIACISEFCEQSSFFKFQKWN